MVHDNNIIITSPDNEHLPKTRKTTRRTTTSFSALPGVKAVASAFYYLFLGKGYNNSNHINDNIIIPGPLITQGSDISADIIII